MKKKFNLSAEVTISIYTIVEAETLEEAIELSGEREIETGQFNTEEQRESAWVADDYDGVPQNIKQEN